MTDTGEHNDKSVFKVPEAYFEDLSGNFGSHSVLVFRAFREPRGLRRRPHRPTRDVGVAHSNPCGGACHERKERAPRREPPMRIAPVEEIDVDEGEGRRQVRALQEETHGVTVVPASSSGAST